MSHVDHRPYQYVSGIFPLSSYNGDIVLMLYLQLTRNKTNLCTDIKIISEYTLKWSLHCVKYTIFFKF